MAKNIVFDNEALELAAMAKAVSHPARVYILRKLSAMHSCCYSGDLVEEIPIGRSALSQHLKELKHAGLIQGKVEPPFIQYSFNQKGWEKLKTAFASFFAESDRAVKF